MERLVAWLGNAPWWLLSAGIHVVVLLATTLIYMERLVAADDGVIIIDWTPPPPPPASPPPPPETPTTQLPGASAENQPVTNDGTIEDPFARIGDRYESDNGMDDHERNGDDLEGTSSINLLLPIDPNRKRPNDTIGIGPGSGSKSFGKRGKDGREDIIKPPGPGNAPPKTSRTTDAVKAALMWLARHQNDDGSWSAKTYASLCTGAKCGGAGEPEFDTGVTALAVLAFLGAGFTNLTHDKLVYPAEPRRVLDFGETMKKAIQRLTACQDSEGCIGPRGPRYMYNHAIAALALSEAWGMTQFTPLRAPAQKAIDFLVAAQNPGKGWRYQKQCGDNDTSVTGWCVMALKSADISELTFDRAAYAGALAWLDEATDDSGYYVVGYNNRGTGKVIVPGKNERFDHHPSMSAVSVMSRIFINKKREPKMGASQLILDDLPEWSANKIDFYYWYYASLALFQLDGPSGPQWKKWDAPLLNALIPHQATAKDGCAHGSWNSDEDRWGFEGGRVYATAINALTLEVYYRYASVFGAGKK